MKNEPNPFDDFDLSTTSLNNKGLKYELARFGRLHQALEWLDADGNLAKLIANTGGGNVQNRETWEELQRLASPREVVVPEAQLERLLYNSWNLGTTHRLLSTGFHRLSPAIMAYQVPLAGKQASEGWGKIDLLGVSREMCPVIIELKRKPKKDAESPVGGILQAVRYGVALREHWRRGPFRETWKAILRRVPGVDCAAVESLPDDLPRLQLLCAAPKGYWDLRGPETPSGERHRQAWSQVCELCDRLEREHQFPTKFVEVDPTDFSTMSLNSSGEEVLAIGGPA